MKKIVFSIISTIMAMGSYAQQAPMANFANWVIESNIRTPKNSVIKFYNAKQELIYQEQIIGKRINTQRLKVRMALNDILYQLLIKNQPVPEPNMVANNLKRN
jgi:hypothetical protein